MNRRSDEEQAPVHLPVQYIWQALARDSSTTPTKVIERTDLSPQLVKQGLRWLESRGWIEAKTFCKSDGSTEPGYSIVADAAWTAAVDLGGTKTHIAIVDLVGNVAFEITKPTDTRGGLHVVEQIAALCEQAIRKAQLPDNRIDIAVVGVPGVPEKGSGRILMAPNIEGVEQLDVGVALETKLKAPVILENDVNLAAIGERWLGAGGQVDNMVFIALGTGIGGGLIVGGELIRGSRNAAGELGFMPFGGDPFDPQTRRDGALESVVATKGMRRRYKELTGKDRDIARIFEFAAQGEDAALRVLDETARYLARAVAATCAMMDPERVVLGGAIGSREELVSRVRDYLLRCFPHAVGVSGSKLGLKAAIAGGAMIARQNLPMIYGVSSIGSSRSHALAAKQPVTPQAASQNRA